MATAEAKGQANTDAITAFLAQVTVYLSLIGFVIQVALTSRIHRLLGIGFALMILPVSLGATGVLMLVVGALWTAGVARVLDTSLRYTVDKTTREILFLPLPADVKYRAKPFIDVTVDRLAKGVGALLILVLIKDWGLALTWQQLSYASLIDHGAVGVLRAARPRRVHGGVPPQHRAAGHEAGEIRLDTADLTTIETLVEELAHPDAKRVIYALDLLESLDKRHLVTPLLLYHESPRGAGAGAARWPRPPGPPAPSAGCAASSGPEGPRWRRPRWPPCAPWPRVKGEEAAGADAALPRRRGSGAGRHRRRRRWRTAPTRPTATRPSEAFRKLIDDTREQAPHPRRSGPRARPRRPTRRSGRCSCR